MPEITRRTDETQVRVQLEPGTGETDIQVGETRPSGADPRIPPGFLAHMVDTLATYARLDVTLEAEGDLEHHLAEDVAIALGRALRQAVDVDRVARVGTGLVPMDDALVEVAVDVVDRPYYHGDLDEVHTLWNHVFRTLAHEARLTLHVVTRRGTDTHHVVEAAAKAAGAALHEALQPRDDVLSTKGSVDLQGDDP